MTHQTVDEVEKAIAELQLKLTELETAKKNMFLDPILLSPEGQLAIFLHERLCTWNHTDGCSWHYFVRNGAHDWTDHAHHKYLNMAREFLSHGYTVENVMGLVNILKDS